MAGALGFVLKHSAPEILHLLVEGKSAKQIASVLELSPAPSRITSTA